MQVAQIRSTVPLVVMALMGVMTLALGYLVESDRGIRVAMAVTLVIIFAGLAFLSPRHLILTMAVWLAALGLIRRVVGGSRLEAGDPLLLVGPAALILLTIVAAGKVGKFKASPLTYMVLILQGVSLLSVLNPLQGGVMVGMAGMMFIPVPTLAFWAGRAFCDDRTIIQLFKLLGMLAVPAAGYGLYQSFYGFPYWDAEWVANFGFASLNVGGITRPFASFSSATDYNTFLGIGLIAWSLFLLRRRPFLGVAMMVVISTALLYGSQRLIIVTGLGALALVLAARRGWPMGGALFLGLFLLIATPLALTYLGPQLEAFQAKSPLLRHQIGGLADPFGEQSSLRLRTSMVTDGVAQVVEHPMGRGIGAPTLAATKFGSDRTFRATDADPSNIAIALGLPGLGLYLALTYVAFKRAYSLAATRRDAVAYAVLAGLGITATQWLTGGQYAVSWIPWLLLGWVDRTTSGPKVEDGTRTQAGEARSLA